MAGPPRGRPSSHSRARSTCRRRLHEAIGSGFRRTINDVFAPRPWRQTAGGRERDWSRARFVDHTVGNRHSPQAGRRAGNGRDQAPAIRTGRKRRVLLEPVLMRWGTRRSTSIAKIQGPDRSSSVARYSSVRSSNKAGKVTRESWNVSRSGSPPVGRMRQTSLSSRGGPGRSR